MILSHPVRSCTKSITRNRLLIMQAGKRLLAVIMRALIRVDREPSYLIIIFLIPAVAAEIALTALPLWTSADPCAQSCAFFLSSSYSASASCPPKDVAGCLCPSAGHSVASVAHECAATTCWTSSTYSEAPAYARVLISSYCQANGHPIATTTAPSGRFLSSAL